jgi:hypothetical protein
MAATLDAALGQASQRSGGFSHRAYDGRDETILTDVNRTLLIAVKKPSGFAAARSPWRRASIRLSSHIAYSAEDLRTP